MTVTRVTLGLVAVVSGPSGFGEGWTGGTKTRTRDVT